MNINVHNKLKPSFNLLTYYILFGFLWIIFSNKIINISTDNLDSYIIFQLYKDLFVLLFTSFVLFKMIKDNLKKDKNIEEIITKKNIKLDRINSNINDLFDISMEMFSPVEYDDRYFIKKIFRIASTVSEENDFGRAYIINDNIIEYIDSIGFDLKELNQLDKDISHYKMSPEKIIIDRDSSLTNIKESISIGIYKDQKIIGGFNLDISRSSDNSYNDNLIKRIQIIQNFSNGLYRIKKYDDYRSVLQNDIVRSFITALEFHDNYTKGHSDMVAVYSMKIGRSLELDKKQLEDLYWAAVMHDIGKIIIPADILNKKEKLTDLEFNLIMKHSQIGYEIISKSKTLQDVSGYILSHHERWDGKGYPNKLKGDKIPLLSQIICVADCWHAMTSERPYKNKLNEKEGIKELIRNKGTQFSPKIVDVFIDKKLYLIN